jgi:hypothetical protein
MLSFIPHHWCNLPHVSGMMFKISLSENTLTICLKVMAIDSPFISQQNCAMVLCLPLEYNSVFSQVSTYNLECMFIL